MRSTIHRAIANARERDRTESINNAFNKLRTLLPTEPAERKLSKVEILRLATSYIRHLSNIKSAKSNGLSERNVCLKSNRDFCTFCITAKKETFEIDNDDSLQKPRFSNDKMDDENLSVEPSALNNSVNELNDANKTIDCSNIQTTILSYGVAYSSTDICDYNTESMGIFVTNVDAIESWSVDGANFVQ